MGAAVGGTVVATTNVVADEAAIAVLFDDAFGLLKSDPHQHGAQHSCCHRGSRDA